MRSFIKNILLISFLVYINSQEKHEIPITYSQEFCLPTIDVLLGEESTPNPFVLDIGQEKSWIYHKKEENLEKKELDSVKFDTFTVCGETKKGHCYLSNKEKNKILKIENFDYLEVPKVMGDEPFLNSISLNNIISDPDKNYGFNIDFPAQKLTIGKFDDNEKGQKLELKEDKWKLNLKAIIFDDINSNKKVENVYKISNTTKGILINRDAFLETVYTPFYVPKDFFDYLEDNNYFYHEKEQLCERTIEKGGIIYLCDKNKKDKIKNMNLVLDDKYVLTITKENLVKCPANSEKCEFIVKFNPKVNNFILGIDVLKNLNIYFMKNEKSIYLKGVDLLECDLTEADLHIIGRKDKMKALFQLIKTFSVIGAIFLFLFIFFYLHGKFIHKESDDKKEEEMIDVDEKEKQ